MKLYNNDTKESYLFSLNDTTLSWDNPVRVISW